MKNISIIVCFLFFAFLANAQYTLQDALFLKANDVGSQDSAGRLRIPERPEVYSVLAKYTANPDVPDLDDIRRTFRDNPFLLIESNAVSRSLEISPGFLSQFGDFDVTNLAIGVADFLVERTKTELNTAFFRRFQEELNDPQYADFALLFPETKRLLDVIGIEIYQFDHYLNALRNAFDQDLRMLLDHLPAVLEQHKSDPVFTAHPELEPSLQVALEVAAWLQQGRHPGEMLRLLANSSYTDILGKLPKPGFTETVHGLQLIAFLSESLRNGNDTEHYWIQEEEIYQLKDPITFKIYLGLLYEQSKKPPYKDIALPVTLPGTSPGDSTITALLKYIGTNWISIRDSTERYRVFVTAMGQKAQSVMYTLTSLQQTQRRIFADSSLSRQAKQQQLFDASFDVFDGFLSLTKQSFEISQLPYLHITIPPDVRQVTDYWQTGGEIALRLSQKQYAGAVADVVVLLNQLFPADDKYKLRKILRYGTFMANIVEADSPEAAKAAIEAVALPPGSYTIKRESRFSVALNGYTGIFGGTEYIKGVENNRWNNLGITAPIGISISWGNIFPKTMRPWSFGLSIPILDLGAVASYRFGNVSDTTNAAATVPTIQLKQLIAPGLIAEFGIGGTPLTLGIGGQIGPRLRKIEREANDVSDFYYRLGISLKVDIPILNFYASPGKK